ncbi:enhanced serine sensitivity protein SseB C-terminal domain-containing protein [Paenibacillus chibensis]|uniref:Enhanced serine sensitivity protein SseB C-terminal domain-containing protein n=1 Tax=Paenibacillus chibensis TaxID=59846 RepID=A0ABU6PR18_9BACL|nr:enhanced serine sensitivity protein SseB C-terminal domain-containing protein [Paenibacillus chibensis]
MEFEPQNKLEEQLVMAAQYPIAREDFYRELLESEVYTIQVGMQARDHQHQTLVSGDRINLINVQYNGTDYVPIFTSLLRLQQFIKEEAQFISMKAKDFFDLTRGTAVLLNPGSSYGKEFLPGEIASLLDGSMFQQVASRELTKDTQMLIGQAAIQPTELLEALSGLFKTMKNVTSAYHAHYFNPDTDESPHTLIAIEFTVDDREALMQQAGRIAGSVQVPNPPVDFIELSEDSGVYDYFKSIEPFYQKKKFKLF